MPQNIGVVTKVGIKQAKQKDIKDLPKYLKESEQEWYMNIFREVEQIGEQRNSENSEESAE